MGRTAIVLGGWFGGNFLLCGRHLAALGQFCDLLRLDASYLALCACLLLLKCGEGPSVGGLLLLHLEHCVQGLESGRVHAILAEETIHDHLLDEILLGGGHAGHW